MENERRDDNLPQGENPGRSPQHNQPPQQGGPQGPQPPGWGNQPQQGYPQQNYPPQQGGQPYSNQPPQYAPQQGYYPPPQYAPQQGYYPPPPGYPQSCYYGRNLCGVGGWLLFMCIYFTIIVPFLTVILYAASLDDVKMVSGRYPAFGKLFVVDTVMSVLLVCFCIFAGYCLWAVRPYAVRIAKTCLVFGMIYRVTAFILVLTASGLPKRVTKAMMPTLMFQLVIGLGILVAWLVYLFVSKRVALTYARGPSADPDRGAY